MISFMGVFLDNQGDGWISGSWIRYFYTRFVHGIGAGTSGKSIIWECHDDRMM